MHFGKENFRCKIKSKKRNEKKEFVLKDIISKLFKIKKTNFIELRNDLLEMIVKEKMLIDNNIINISDPLCDVLGISRKSTTTINQIDNMVTLLLTGKKR